MIPYCKLPPDLFVYDLVNKVANVPRTNLDISWSFLMLINIIGWDRYIDEIAIFWHIILFKLLANILIFLFSYFLWYRFVYIIIGWDRIEWIYKGYACFIIHYYLIIHYYTIPKHYFIICLGSYRLWGTCQLPCYIMKQRLDGQSWPDYCVPSGSRFLPMLCTRKIYAGLSRVHCYILSSNIGGYHHIVILIILSLITINSYLYTIFFSRYVLPNFY